MSTHPIHDGACRGRRGRVEGAGRQPELGLALKLPPHTLWGPRTCEKRPRGPDSLRARALVVR
eukprot:scaffold86442_cov29-Phaeocystis_antarctica.AAC.1